MKIAAIQLNAELADVKGNLRKTEQYIAQAASQGAKLIILPEFFTSAIGFDKKMLDVPKLNNGVHEELVKWARYYNTAIGGSYISFDGENAYNLFELVFPNGGTYSHKKDLPTQFENCYYANGDENNVIDTPIGRIGVALCWEMIRTDTLKRISENVDLVVAGSCWWDLPDNAPPEREELRRYNQNLAEETPAVFAKLAGVPLVHASHCGKISGKRFPAADCIQMRKLVGAAQIVDGNGNALSKRLFSEGAGFVIQDIALSGTMRRNAEIPDRYWIPELPQSYIDAWETLNPIGKRYYNETALPYYRGIIV